MEKHYVVMTAIGADRPGLVDAVSAYVYKRGGNVESTRAATLGGEFAMILLISGDEKTAESIRLQTGELERDAGLAVVVKPTGAPAEHPRTGRFAALRAGGLRDGPSRHRPGGHARTGAPQRQHPLAGHLRGIGPAHGHRLLPSAGHPRRAQRPEHRRLPHRPGEDGRRVERGHPVDRRRADLTFFLHRSVKCGRAARMASAGRRP
ncbi:MAG: hypothetical protein GX591_10890 [Planctomycetes bacterium]|nr:hypothetical protein [Planctomycetota bacterium]